jgi:hypothetical protein
LTNKKIGSAQAFLEKINQVSTRQINFLRSIKNEVADGEQAIAALAAKRQEIEAELRPMKSKLAAEQEALRVAREERSRQITDFDKAIEARQQKLSALEAMIDEKKKILGDLIAREL